MKRGNRFQIQSGSITVFLCMLFLVFLMVFSVALQAVRVSAARVTLASAAEQSMFSVFGSYDRELFERYGLMFVNAESGNGSLAMSSILTQAEDYASYIISPKKESVLPLSADILNMKQKNAEITAYTLATDGGFALFTDQIQKALEAKLTADGVTKLTADGKKKLQEKASEAKKDSDRLKEENRSETEYTEEDVKRAQTIENPPDPRDVFNGLKSMGLLYAAIPSGKTVSDKEIDPEKLLTGRELNQGMGSVDTSGHVIVDQAVLEEYAMRMFPNFANPMEEEALQYQVEYLIGGKNSDAKNLQSVIRRILVIREACNLAFLAKDPQKRSEVLSMATSICTAVGLPALIPGVSWAIRAGWAYAEGIADVRKLLGGGRVPIAKTAETWQINMTGLSDQAAYTGAVNRSAGDSKMKNRKNAGNGKTESGNTGKGNADGENSPEEKESGLDYQAYLRMLLLTQKQDTLKQRMAAMIEHTMQTVFGKENFHLDNCIGAAGIRFRASIGGRELTCDRNYAYGQDSLIPL